MKSESAETLRGMAWSILFPLEESGIETYHSDPHNLRIRTSIGPTTLSFGIELVYPEKHTKKVLKMGSAISTYMARELDLKMGKTITPRIAHQGAYIIVEVPRQNPWRPTLPEVKDRLSNEVFLGLSSQGEPRSIDLFYRQEPGLYVVGRSGSGKTNAIRLIMAQGIAKGWDVGLIDLKGGGDWRGDLAHYANLGVAYTEDEATELLGKISDISNARNRGEVPKDQPILVIFDEIHRAAKKSKTQLIFGDLCSTCRSVNIRLIGGSQRAGNEIHPKILTSLDTRLVGKVQSDNESYLACGMKGAGAESLQNYGDMLYVIDGVISARIQVPNADGPYVSFLLPMKPQPEPEKPTQDKTPKRTASEAGQTPLNASLDGQSSGQPQPTPINPKNLFEKISFEYERLELKSHRAKKPPLWLVVRASLWALRHGYQPQDKTLRAWAKAPRQGKVGRDLSKNQRLIVRQLVSDTVGISN